MDRQGLHGLLHWVRVAALGKGFIRVFVGGSSFVALIAVPVSLILLISSKSNLNDKAVKS